MFDPVDSAHKVTIKVGATNPHFIMVNPNATCGIEILVDKLSKF